VVLLVALLIFPLVVAALAAIGSAMSHDARRGLDQTTDAQLEQMLLAAAHAAQQQLDHGSLTSQPQAVPIPMALQEAGAGLTLEVVSRSDHNAEVRLRATLQRRSASQMVQFARSDGAWRVTSAQLQQ
jgi:hypothetical protein